MSEDWQVGDLALCVTRDPIDCPTDCIVHTGENCPAVGTVRRVLLVCRSDAAKSGLHCHCVGLRLDDGSCGLVRRFRKIRHDEHEDCEPEFVELLQRIKRTVDA